MEVLNTLSPGTLELIILGFSAVIFIALVGSLINDVTGG